MSKNHARFRPRFQLLRRPPPPVLSESLIFILGVSSCGGSWRGCLSGRDGGGLPSTPTVKATIHQAAAWIRHPQGPANYQLATSRQIMRWLGTFLR